MSDDHDEPTASTELVSNMDRDMLDRTFRVVLGRLDGKLPTLDIENAESLIVVGEQGIALENLCTQLDEYDVVVSRDVLAQIRAMGQSMGIRPRYWTVLSVEPEPEAR